MVWGLTSGVSAMTPKYPPHLQRRFVYIAFCILHPIPCTLHPTPFILHPTSYALHPTSFTLQVRHDPKVPPPSAEAVRVGLRMKGLGSQRSDFPKISGSGLRVWSFGCRVWSLGCGEWIWV